MSGILAKACKAVWQTSRVAKETSAKGQKRRLCGILKAARMKKEGGRDSLNETACRAHLALRKRLEGCIEGEMGSRHLLC